MDSLRLSPLGHTWLLDLDGTLVKHNGHIKNGFDTPIREAEEFVKSLPEEDMIVFVTSRLPAAKELTERFLSERGIRFDLVVYGAPHGERILVNDRKPSGLQTAFAISPERDRFDGVLVETDFSL
jgi:hypothetical protein